MSDPFWKRSSFGSLLYALGLMLIGYLVADRVPGEGEWILVLGLLLTVLGYQAARPTVKAPKGSGPKPPVLLLLLVLLALGACTVDPGPGPWVPQPPVPVPVPEPPLPAPVVERAALESVSVGDSAEGLTELLKLGTPTPREGGGTVYVFVLAERRPEGGNVRWEIHLVDGKVAASFDF